MTTKVRLNFMAMALVLMYGFAVMCWGVAMNHLTPDEAKTIFIGRKAVSGLGVKQVGAVVPADGMADKYLGSAVLAPAADALADHAAGFYGARLVGVIFCLLLVMLLYKTGNTPLYGGRGVLTAATFVLMGTPLQLSPSANGDACAAMFLAASLLCVEHAAGLADAGKRAFTLLFGAVSLALAVMANYTAMLFVVPLLLYVFLRHRPLTAGMYFVLPSVFLLAFYGYFAVLPVWPDLKYEIALFHPPSGAGPTSSWLHVFNLLDMFYLLTVLGIFHKDGGKNSLFMLAVAAPALLIQYVSTDLNYMHTAALFSMVILAPAAALGVAQLSEIFSSYNDMRLARPFFVTAVLAVIWVFGIQEIRALKVDRPDLSQAAAYLETRCGNGSTVLVDSDFGSPELVYRYYLSANSPSVRVVSVTRGGDKQRRDAVAYQHPDYVVVDSYHNARSFEQASRDYRAQGLKVTASYNMPSASGIKNILIFQKGAL